MLTRPLPDLAAWTTWLREQPIPVLPYTADAIEALRPCEDELDAHTLAEHLSGDPLMTLQLLAHAARIRPPHYEGAAETVTAALVFLGIGPFFRLFQGLVTTDALLQGRDDARCGLEDVLRRAARAATFSLGFAVHRMDADAAVLHEAALLHGFSEMLLWCHAPDLALEIRERQRRDPALRSAAVQQEVLHTTLPELEQALMRAWMLPETLVRLTDERRSSEPAVRNVLLAIRVARHTQHGWDNAAVPDDVRDVAELLNLSEEAARHKLQELDA
ncbi:MAG TPA: HDOD domain-containing protein [Burkholderiaceae bacterium]|nr:HDOD domain-containing protein [Burkholderiaceae bacterium]